MKGPEAPQGYVVATECKKAAFDNGYRRSLVNDSGWSTFGSTTAKGDIALGGAGPHGPWFMALDHAGVVAELRWPQADLKGPGQARYQFSSLSELYDVLKQVYALAVSLPDGPLQTFQQATKGLPRTTEAERTVVQRIGQDIFRDRLMTYWQGHCPLTGISEPALLRASHAKPWKDCETDAERLDVHNGMLLSALWDAAFDKGLVTFSEEGTAKYSDNLGEAARNALQLSGNGSVELSPGHQEFMHWHRLNIFQWATH